MIDGRAGLSHCATRKTGEDGSGFTVTKHKKPMGEIAEALIQDDYFYGEREEI